MLPPTLSICAEQQQWPDGGDRCCARAASAVEKWQSQLAPLGLPLQLDLTALRSECVLCCLQFNVSLRHALDLLTRPHLELLACFCLHLGDPLLGLHLLGVSLDERLVFPIRESRQPLVTSLLADSLHKLIHTFALHEQLNHGLLLVFERRLACTLHRHALGLAVPQLLLPLEEEMIVAVPLDVKLRDPLAFRLLDRTQSVHHIKKGIFFFNLVLLGVGVSHLHGQLASLALDLRDEVFGNGPQDKST
mmetsp:Transcript_17410/g.40873  ORF Transcript_17410/g.40873 Transcript_17410/m.40873 type:complete len:248 (+) Transcript_17410:77-820(+)